MSDFEKWFNRALKLLSFRPRSKKEILNWLDRKKILPGLQKQIIDRLEELNFVNDSEFVKWWVEQRTTFKPMGKRAIEMELKQKGVDRETIVQLFDGSIVTSEKDLAKRAAEKKMRIWQKLPDVEFRQKMTAYLSRRGFGWEIIKETVDEILKKG